MDLPVRKCVRLKDYDYSENGMYYVTICTQDRKCLFGEIVCGENISLNLNNYGKIVKHYIDQINVKYPSAHIAKYIIMPNHIHMVVDIQKHNVGAGVSRPETTDQRGFGTDNPSPTLGKIVGWFKYKTTCDMNDLIGTPGKKLWQRSYHEHVIRNVQSYLDIWEYIETNPLKWAEDEYYTHR